MIIQEQGLFVTLKTYVLKASCSVSIVRPTTYKMYERDILTSHKQYIVRQGLGYSNIKYLCFMANIGFSLFVVNGLM